jgi:hypothetical protein
MLHAAGFALHSIVSHKILMEDGSAAEGDLVIFHPSVKLSDRLTDDEFHHVRNSFVFGPYEVGQAELAGR